MRLHGETLLELLTRGKWFSGICVQVWQSSSHSQIVRQVVHAGRTAAVN